MAKIDTRQLFGDYSDRARKIHNDVRGKPSRLYGKQKNYIDEKYLLYLFDASTLAVFSRGGWVKVACPAHDDHNPSLSILRKEGGQAYIECRSGCDMDIVHQRLKDGSKDHSTIKDLPKMSKVTHNSQGYASPEAAMKAFLKGYNHNTEFKLSDKPDHIHEYRSKHGHAASFVYRWNLPDGGKTFGQVTKKEKAWHIGAMERPKLLYNLDKIEQSPPKRSVYIFEGELCCDRAVKLGLLSTTSSQGSGSFDATDWGPLSGRTVYIFPDNDAPGAKYASGVLDILEKLTPPAKVKVIELPGLDKGGDLVDWVRMQGDLEPDKLRARLMKIVNGEASTRPTTNIQTTKTTNDEHESEPYCDDTTPSEYDDDYVEGWEALPLECFPDRLRGIIERQAQSIQCDPSFLALPMIGVVGAALGDSRILKIRGKKNWTPRAVFWASIAAMSGSRKTPALKFVTAPAWDHEHKLKEHFDTAMLVYQTEMEAWNRSKERDPAEKPERPIRETFVIKDSTIETINSMHVGSPRGLLGIYNELGQWFGNADRYARGAEGGDESVWLNYFDGDPVKVDRKTGEPHERNILLSDAYVSLVGVIPPAVLSRYLGPRQKESGLAARLLVAMPPKKRAVWTEDGNEDDSDAWGRIVGAILSLQAPPRDGSAGPKYITTDESAHKLWIEFFNRHQIDMEEVSESLCAVYSKLENYCLKFSLVLHVLKWACDLPDKEDLDARARFSKSEPPWLIDEDTMMQAIVLTEWFKNESRRVYAYLEPLASNNRVDENSTVALQFVKRKGIATARELRNNFQAKFTLESAEKALAELVESGLLEVVPGGKLSRSPRYQIKQPVPPIGKT